jgi:hypothetical protein
METQELVDSPKLRNKAIRAFIRISDSKALSDKIAIRFGIRQTCDRRIDQVIVPALTEQDLRPIIEKVQGQGGLEVPLDNAKK